MIDNKVILDLRNVIINIYFFSQINKYGNFKKVQLDNFGRKTMSHFDLLLVAHLIGDFLFQTNWMAKNKTNKYFPLFVHTGLYTIIVAFIAWLSFGGLPLWGILTIFIVHTILDKRIFVEWWIQTIMMTKENDSVWLKIVVDQIFHILVLAVISYFI
ncbi:MAG: DUF3307 domain-containing protein [Desulfitobacteriaceae bacterium]